MMVTGKVVVKRLGLGLGLAIWLLSACSDGGGGDDATGLPQPVLDPAAPGSGSAAPATPTSMAGDPLSQPAAAQPAGTAGAGAEAAEGAAGASAGAEASGAAGASADTGTEPVQDSGGGGSGPVDGDPAAPMVEVPGVPCGAPNLSFLGVPAENMVQIGGRDVFVAYPCAHRGAQVTFFLFIHGTLQEGQKIPFTMTNFPVHTKVDSDNFIVVTPQAIGTQWGNGDGGQDLPHLYEVIDWVYATFGDQFDIRTMWASGGSWGAFYLSTFACDPMLDGRLNGVRMVVGPGCPRCSDKLACIVAQQELELGGGSPLSDDQKEMRVMAANVEPYATMHGCGPREGPTNLGPVRAWTWPGCNPGFAHSYYLGAGQHADRWDDPIYLDHAVAEIKSIEP
ncbi:MAG: hypothetical protein OEZ06_04995 [Myxococcales bacterium]|nr:hypothetical protein [Myxococcales bacterium]